MCGIVGYVGSRDAVPIIVEGLRRLEYRGYDSAGIAVVRDGVLTRRRAAGKLQNLEESLRKEPLSGQYGVGHTRWATHGRPTEENAHPHQDGQGKIVVVHNGIIENYLALKGKLQAAGHAFVTQTDTEVVAHLVAHHYAGSLEEAVRKAVAEIEGIYALVLLHSDEPQRLVGARLGPPLVVGVGEGERFLASDLPALLAHTRDFLFLEDGEIVTITPDSTTIRDAKGAVVTRAPQRISWDPVQAEKGGYRHFMLKEIHEQPRAVRGHAAGENRARRRGGLPPGARASLLGTQGRPARDPDRLRHELARRSRGQVPAGAGGGDTGGSGLRLGVPVSDAHRGGWDARRRHLPERRDGRHPGRVPGGQAARRASHRHLQRAGVHADPRGRWDPSHPRRARDRRGFHQGVHVSGRGPRPPCAAPRSHEGDAHDGCLPRASREPRAGPAPHGADPRLRGPGRGAGPHLR